MIEPTTAGYVSVAAAIVLGVWCIGREIYHNRKFKRLRDSAVAILARIRQAELEVGARVTDVSRMQDGVMAAPADESGLYVAAESKLIERLNEATGRLTAFKTFGKLVNAQGYTLSINLIKCDAQFLAAAYDENMRRKGLSKRANTYTT